MEDKLKEILAFQIHDTGYEDLKGQDKLSIDQAITALTTLIDQETKRAAVYELETLWSAMVLQGLSSNPKDYIGAHSTNLNYISERIKELNENL